MAAAAPLQVITSLRRPSTEVDLLDNRRIHSFIDKVRPAVMFNLAGYSVDRRELDPWLAQQINTELPAVLGAAIARYHPGIGGVRLVHVGSGMEYGRSACELRETSIPGPPDTLYARTKLAGTVALERFCGEQGFCALTARLFTVYGPGEHAGRLLTSLMEAAQHRTELRLTAGHQQRDFTYVSDVAEGLLRLGAAAAPPAHAIVNLATGRMASVRQFAETAAKILGIPISKLKFGPLPVRFDEMNYTGVSLERLRALTGWSPDTDLVRGITATMQFAALSDPSEKGPGAGQVLSCQS